MRAVIDDRTISHAEDDASPCTRPVEPIGGRSVRRPPSGRRSRTTARAVFDLKDLEVYYGAFRAVRDVELNIRTNEITAFIGPSGCGKTTVLRCFNRMNDLIPTAPGWRASCSTTASTSTARSVGHARCAAASAWCSRSPTRSRRASTTTSPSAPRSTASRKKSELDDIVEQSLRGAALWDEVKDRLKNSALGLSGGQQQRLCIARTIAVEPEVMLMDEPCSALDPIATARIEDLMQELKRALHDRDRHPQHAAGRPGQRPHRVLHRRGRPESDHRTGVLVEYDRTEKIFSNPTDERTENYITGRFG